MVNGCLRFVPGSHRWGDKHVGLGTNEDFSPQYDPTQLPPQAR